MATVFVIIILFGGAKGLRDLTIANLSATQIPDKNTLVVSIFLHTDHYLQDVIYKTMVNESLEKALSEKGNVSFTAHILPSNYRHVCRTAQRGGTCGELHIMETFPADFLVNRFDPTGFIIKKPRADFLSLLQKR